MKKNLELSKVSVDNIKQLQDFIVNWCPANMRLSLNPYFLDKTS
jgi:hypothetical protein